MGKDKAATASAYSPSDNTALSCRFHPSFFVCRRHDDQKGEESQLHSRDIVNGLEPSLFVGHPKLSSQEDGVLYLMAQVDVCSDESRVIAVNMNTKKLEGVAKFTTQRKAGMSIAFKHTTISKYLAPPGNKSEGGLAVRCKFINLPFGDPKRILKRRGPAMSGSSRKKPHQVEEGDEKNLPSMGDSMDLD